MKTIRTASTSSSSRSNQLKKLAAVIALVSVAVISRADHFYTNNATGDYNVTNYWDPNSVPNDNTHNNNGSNNVVLIQDGDPIWNHGDTLAGDADGASGAYLQTGSTNNTGGGNWLRMGLNVGSFGSYVISNGVCNVGGRIQIGEKGAGYLEVSGGTMKANANDTGANPGLVAGDGHFAVVTDNFPVGTVVLNSGTLNIGNGEVWFGNGDNDSNSRGTGHFIMHGGTFNVNNWFVFGRFGAAGDGYMDGGVINKNNNGNVQIGVGSMNSGTTGGQGYFTQMGGTFNCGSQYQIATDANVTQATNDIGGDAILNVNDWLAIGRNGGHGTLNISGNAAITKSGNGNLTLGSGGASVGVINQSGGAITNTTTPTFIGESGTATAIWSMTGGTTILGDVYLAYSGGANGTLVLGGGLFQANGISSPTYPATTTVLDFNGGTLRAGANNDNFISSLTEALMDAGGAVIDSQGFNVGIPQALQNYGGGGLTKLGSGTLTLSGANNYIGDTVINAGTLATTTASTGGGNYTVADNAALGVTVVSGNPDLKMSALTLGSSVGAAVDFDLGSFGNPSSAPINVNGALNVGGTITVNITDSNPNYGQFPLIKYSSGGGDFVMGSLPLGVGAYISNNVDAGSIDLVITNVNLPRWEGLAGGDWDIGVTTNWVNLGDGLPFYYADDSIVLFDDNAQGTTDVNLTTTVSPYSVTVNNSAKTYTFGGSGKISGDTGLLKTGNGTLVITNSGGNDYTGQTIISGGSLNVTSLADGGSPSSIGAASSDPANLVLSDGTLVYSGPDVAIDRGYSISGTNQAEIDVTNTLALSGVVIAPGSGSFAKGGSGTLAYTTAGNNQLSSADYGVRAGSVRFDGSAGAQSNSISGGLSVAGSVSASATLTNTTVMTGENVDVGNVPGTFGTLEIDNGTTVNVGSWVTLGDGANSTASLTMNGGTLNVLSSSSRLFLCSAPGTTATFTMNGGTINKSGDYFAIVNGGWNGAGARTGVVNQVNGTINCQSECWIGDAGGTNSGALGIYNLSGGTLNVSNWFGVGRDGPTAIFNMTGGTLHKGNGGNGDGDMVIGRGGSHGTFTMSGGTINKDAGNPIIFGQGQGVAEFDMSGGALNSGAEFWLGVDNGTIATNNISGTAQLNIHNYVTIGRAGLGVVNMSGGQFNSDVNQFIVGVNGGGQGVWNQSGGSLYVNQEIWIGQGDNNAYGTLNLSGGTITNTSWLAVGREGGHGTLNITGGTMVKTGGGNISIAHNGGASGDVIISGTGTFICASGETWVGENAAPGTWTMNGGTAILGLVHLAQNADATGVLNLNGGSLTATEIATGNTGAARRELNFNGGTLVAGADNANFIHDLSAANVLANGAVIDTATYTIGVNQALLGDASGDGGLVKNGSGVLYLNGVNTYTNLTQVNAGALGGSGTIAGPVAIADGARLSPGTASIGTLTIDNALNLDASSSTAVKISADGSPTSDAVAGLTSVTYGGTLVVTNSGAAPLVTGSQFQLFTAASHTGNFANAASVTILPAGKGAFDPATGKLIITASGAVSFNPVRVSGGNLILTGDGGAGAGSNYTLLMSTNVATPLSLWETNATGTLDANGMFSNSIPINPLDAHRFFGVRVP